MKLTPKYNLIKDNVNTSGLIVKNWKDTTCYMFHNDMDVIMDINDWLLELFPAYYGMISYGNADDTDGVYNTKRKYYISIAIYEDANDELKKELRKYFNKGVDPFDKKEGVK